MSPSEDGVGDANAASDANAEIEVRALLLYLFVQTYARAHAQSAMRESGGTEEWPIAGDAALDATTCDGGVNGGAGSGGSSPRSSPGREAPGSPGSRGSGGGAAGGGKAAETEILRAKFVLHHFVALAGLCVDDDAKVGGKAQKDGSPNRVAAGGVGVGGGGGGGGGRGEGGTSS